jgi:vitamin B12 transporter
MKLLIKLLSLSIFFFSLILPAIPAFGDSGSGILRGLVTDARGMGVRGARVVLIANKLAIRETMTGESGGFVFFNLRPGDYSLAIEAEGLTQSGGAQPIKIVDGGEFRVVVPLIVAAIQDAIVVSATRTDALIGETPSSTTVISAKELQRSQQANVFDALRFTSGVSVSQTARRGGVTSLFLRGGESDFTKVLIDGVPINDAGGAINFADLTTDNAARIELVRGAQSATYGSDAMTGVVQLFTHRGTTATPEFIFSGEGGSFGFNREAARFSGMSRVFDYSLSYSHLSTDGRDRNDDYQNRVVTANLGYQFNRRTQLRMTTRNDNSGLGVAGPTAILFPDPDERAKAKRNTLGLRLDDQTRNNWQQNVSFAFSQSRSLGFDPIAQDLSQASTPLDSGFAFNDFASYFNNYQRRRGVRYQSNIVLAARNFATLGIDYEDEDAVFDNGLANVSRVSSNRTNWGAYLQDQFSYGPRLFVTAGARVEYNRSEVPMSFASAASELGSTPFTGKVGYGTKVMPKLSLIYVLSLSGLQARRGTTRLKANYGHGIKTPSLLEAFSPNPLFFGNPDLRPERSRNFDVGIEQYLLWDRLRIEGIYFDNRFLDLITFVGNPATFGGPVMLPDGRYTNYINNDRARARGVELSVNMSPNRWLQIGGNYTFLKSELTSSAQILDFSSATPQLIANPEVGLPLLRRPRNSGSLYASLVASKFDVNLYGLFTGQRRDGDPASFLKFDSQGRPIYNSGYQKVDLTGAYRMTNWWSMFGRVENLLNQDYQEVLGYPSYRLNFSAGMRFRIGGGK